VVARCTSRGIATKLSAPRDVRTRAQALVAEVGAVPDEAVADAEVAARPGMGGVNICLLPCPQGIGMCSPVGHADHPPWDLRGRGESFLGRAVEAPGTVGAAVYESSR
jgi:hypothetical protein